jgi:cytochrome bd-type quinol oxidase subunit 2
MPPIAKLRGEGLLLVVGILMIIVGAFTTGSGLISRLSSGMTVSMLGLGESAVEYFNLVSVVALVAGLILLAFGIFGIRLRKRAEKANLLILLGIIHIIVRVFILMYNNVIAKMGESINAQIYEATEQMTGMSIDTASLESPVVTIIGIVFAFILPALFLVGAFLNKQPPKIPAHLQAFYAEQQRQGGAYTQLPQEQLYAQPMPAPAQSDSPYEQGYQPPEEK